MYATCTAIPYTFRDRDGRNEKINNCVRHETLKLSRNNGNSSYYASQ